MKIRYFYNSNDCFSSLPMENVKNKKELLLLLAEEIQDAFATLPDHYNNSE